MSLADALNPQLAEHAPVDDAYLPRDVEQSAPVDRDEEMDDLFDEDAVVDQADRYPHFTFCLTLQPIQQWYVGTLSQKRVRIGWWAARRDF